MTMQHFDDYSPNRNKEKNVYLLHLDATRIVLIICALLGIVIIAFLIGMNFPNEEQNDHQLTTATEALLAPLPDEPTQVPSEHRTFPSHEMEMSDKSTNSTTSLKPEQKPPSQTSVAPAKQNSVSSEPTTISKTEKQDHDLPFSGSGSEISSSEKSQLLERKNKHHSALQKKKNIERHSHERTRIASKTVEVASKNSRIDVLHKEGYSVQVAAYSSRSKAIDEVNRLKSHRYDPFIEATHVNGKSLFRVKIGPIASRKEAEKILDELKEMNRYQHSYITRE